MRTCNNCGAPLEPDAQFCTECGTKVEIREGRKCPSCGAPLDDDSLFCSECGCKLEDVSQAQPIAEPKAEEPHVGKSQEVASDLTDVTTKNSTDDILPVTSKSSYVKWLVFGGCAMAFLGFLVWMIWGYNASSGKFDNLPMEQVFPKVKKIVEVKSEMMNVRQGPGEDYDIVKFEDPGFTPIEIHVSKGQLLAVLEEQDGWYKIACRYNGYIEGYINAAYCSDVDYGGLSEDPNYYTWYNSDGECGGLKSVVHQSKGNHLVVLYDECDCDANVLRLGIYQKGFYIFWYSIPVTYMSYAGEKQGFELKPNEEGIFYEGWFGNNMARYINVYGMEWNVMDWDKVSEIELAELFHSQIAKGEKMAYILSAKEMEAYGNLKVEKIN